jgi:hypothetical protein
MDETAYRQALTSSIPRYCPFEKSVLTHCAACSRAVKHNIAEREVVACNSAQAHERCIALRALLRSNFAFALGKLHIEAPLPHAQEMRMQCGGLKGLQVTLDGNEVVADVDSLLDQALQRYGDLGELPYSQIVQRANMYYKGR